MRREDDGGAVRHLVQLLDEHRAHVAQPLDDMPVVHHLVTHEDRRAEQHDRPLDDVDGAIDAGAEPARVGEAELHAPPPARSRRHSRNASKIMSAAPTVIAASAMLNAGFELPQWTWMKSTT